MQQRNKAARKIKIQKTFLEIKKKKFKYIVYSNYLNELRAILKRTNSKCSLNSIIQPQQLGNTAI